MGKILKSLTVLSLGREKLGHKVDTKNKDFSIEFCKAHEDLGDVRQRMEKDN